MLATSFLFTSLLSWTDGNTTWRGLGIPYLRGRGYATCCVPFYMEAP